MILTTSQKEAVVKIYTSKIKPKTIPQLAFFLRVSERTIQRVLDMYSVEWRMKLNPVNKNSAVIDRIDLDFL